MKRPFSQQHRPKPRAKSGTCDTHIVISEFCVSKISGIFEQSGISSNYEKIRDKSHTRFSGMTLHFFVCAKPSEVEMTKKIPTAITVSDIDVQTGSGYPPPYDEPTKERRCRLGDLSGLTDFGVNVVELPPGAWSSQRHWHSHEDDRHYSDIDMQTLKQAKGRRIYQAGWFTAGVRQFLLNQRERGILRENAVRHRHIRGTVVRIENQIWPCVEQELVGNDVRTGWASRRGWPPHSTWPRFQSDHHPHLREPVPELLRLKPHRPFPASGCMMFGRCHSPPRGSQFSGAPGLDHQT